MSEKFIVRARRLPDGTVVQLMPNGSIRPFSDETDWERVRAMTEEEVEAAALSNPDNPPLTDKELGRFRTVPNPKDIRKQLHNLFNLANAFRFSPDCCLLAFISR